MGVNDDTLILTQIRRFAIANPTIKCSRILPNDCIYHTVRITYNEDSNVTMTVTGGASQLRGSELF